jgi:hypothetical protein
MPILDPSHDLPHAVESDDAWSESYYFNAYDPQSNSGLFTRIGVRPNEGTMDVGLSVWLPDGRLAEYRSVRTPPDAVDAVLDVGAVRYTRIDAARSWSLTMRGEAPARACTPGGESNGTVDLAMELRFDSLTPAIGTDGSGRAPRTAEAAAASDTVGRGHFEQAGAWSGWLEVDGARHTWSGVLGNRDRSWGPRRWGGPQMWRWFSINVSPSLHFGGIRLGTSAGDLHRGWVFDDGRASSVAAWRLRTETADDGLTQRVVHLEVEDKQERRYSLRGDVLRVADIGRAGGTLVNEGLARWTYLDGAAAHQTGFGICEYLHQLDADGRPLVAIE